MEQAAQTLTIDGVNHEVTNFSPAIQQAVGIYNTFQADLQKAQMEVVKVQAAVQSIGNQISEAVKAELEAGKEAVAE